MSPGKRKHPPPIAKPQEMPCIYRCPVCTFELPYASEVSIAPICARCRFAAGHSHRMEPHFEVKP